jgi:protein-tyrosine-phosphatase
MQPRPPAPAPAAAQGRGVRLTSRSRPLTPLDWGRFHYIVGMDAKNRRDIVRASEHWCACLSLPPGSVVLVPLWWPGG